MVMSNQTFPSLETFLLGLHPELFNTNGKRDSFPRYNIREQHDPETKMPTSLEVDFALAGYRADQLQVYVENGNLYVGTNDSFKNEETCINERMVHQGITQRKFKISFNLSSQISHSPTVTFKDGILSVKFSYIEPNRKLIPIL